MKVKVVLVGAGGYGETYLLPLLNDIESNKYEFVAIVERRDISECTYADEILKHNIPVYESLDEYFKNGNKADLVIIATPPHFHTEQSILSVQNGANVLCEKPITPLYDDALKMLEASKKTDRFIAIGYQWSYSTAIRTLKNDILSGKLGKAKQLKSFISWPRGWSYYNGWKGKLRDNDGTWILDSIVGNAAAHYLHNMYFLLGREMNLSMFPKTIKGELFRANDIENFDSCVLDISTEDGTKIFYVASHATDKDETPKFQFEFENAVVSFNMDEINNKIIARFNDGSVIDYGNPDSEIHNRLWEAIDSASRGTPMTCTVETALAHTYTINELHMHGRIIDFPKELLIKNKETEKTIVNGLYELLFKSFEKCKLLSDMGVMWAFQEGK